MNEIFQAIIQGILQGATEFLPVSSSGHLALSQHLMGSHTSGLSGLLFDVMLHLGTLAAVLLVYHKLIWRLIQEFCRMVRDLFTGKFKWSEMNGDRNLVMMLIIGLLPLFLLFIPIPGTGMNLKDIGESFANGQSIMIVGFSLLLTSVLLTLGLMKSKKMVARFEAEPKQGKRHPVGRRRFNVIDALSVGLAQCLAAVLPGLSRSGSTLSVGLLRGINRQAALDYSFVIGIPSILAAAVLEFKDAMVEGAEVPVLPMIIGVVVAAVVGFFAIKLLRWMVASNKLLPFIIYTAVLGIAVLIISFIEQGTGNNLFTGNTLAALLPQ